MNGRHSVVAVFAAAAIGLIPVSSSLSAHHGSSISYETDKPWTAKAVVTDFKYMNPHPLLFFTITDERGNTAAWKSELGTNPSRLARLGWTRARTEAALKPGTVVILTLATAKVGGLHAIVERIQSEQGEPIAESGGGRGRGREGVGE